MMNKILLLVVILVTSFKGAFAFELKDQMVQPFERDADYRLRDFIREYAAAMNKRVVISSNIGKYLNTHLNIKIYKEISTKELSDLFYQELAANGLTAVKNRRGLMVMKARDIRYWATETYSGDKIPDDHRIVHYFFQLKYPLAKEIERTSRPFQSRFGRIYTLSDRKSLIIMDKAKKVRQFVEFAKKQDTKEAFEKWKRTKIMKADKKRFENSKPQYEKKMDELLKMLKDEKKPHKKSKRTKKINRNKLA